ncbi:leucine-rich repeat-containing protein 73 isoform X3 [Cololabis saira]|uniref:leucine-rich repeat-containing protein 73 isoform X3 n=1 Tax=Cololabis saira TaxID=129043 RepID=UPI002AD3EC36|nr:leucine-rich repeat-containing protein 73 isoform X3 [Cololabis saira]
MLPASIQITGELLSAAEVQDIVESLKEDGVRLLSVRGCQLSDRDFGRVCRGVAESHSLAQLNLNLGVVSGIGRTRQLADALRNNRSLQTLFLHGSPLLDAGLVALNAALATHPALVCLDLGDCMLGDEALALICGMLPPDGAKSGDPIAGMLSVAVASSRTLEVLDLEGTGLTNQSAQGLWLQVFLDMVQNFPTSLRVLVLVENQISLDLQQQIRDLLEGDEDPDQDQDRDQDQYQDQDQDRDWEAPPLQRRPASSRALQPIRDKYQPPNWLAHSSLHTVTLTSGLGESLLAETEM